MWDTIRKLLLISILPNVFAAEASAYLCAGLLVSLVSAFVLLQCKPFVDPLLDRVQTSAILVLTLTMLYGVLIDLRDKLDRFGSDYAEMARLSLFLACFDALPCLVVFAPANSLICVVWQSGVLIAMSIGVCAVPALDVLALLPSPVDWLHQAMCCNSNDAQPPTDFEMSPGSNPLVDPASIDLTVAPPSDPCPLEPCSAVRRPFPRQHTAQPVRD